MSEPARVCYLCGVARYLQHLVDSSAKIPVCIWCFERIKNLPKLGVN